jgi:hypothetical protein
MALGLVVCGPKRLVAQGNVTIQAEKVMAASSLSAVVIDPNDNPMQGVLVEEMGENWKGLLRSTRTDATGRFSFAPVKGRKIYYFMLTIPNFDQLQFRMRVSVFSRKPLKVRMKVGD